MIKELWQSFPRTLEEKINGLLDEAEPSPAKSFQLYKTCQQEGAWPGTFEQFADKINHFFALPRLERRKSQVDSFLDQPLSAYAFESFELDFRSASVSDKSVLDLASWAHHLMRVGSKIETVVISTDVLTKTLRYIIHPPLFEKARDIQFQDFCDAWKKTVFQLFGRKHDSDFQKIYNELQWLHRQLQEEATAGNRTPAFAPTIYLTQTEIDWTEAVRIAALEFREIPKFPLSRGPQKQRLIDLARTISLYKVVQTTKHTDFIKHRDSIRATILDRCEGLLRECAR